MELGQRPELERSEYLSTYDVAVLTESFHWQENPDRILRRGAFEDAILTVAHHVRSKKGGVKLVREGATKLGMEIYGTVWYQVRFFPL